MKSFALAPGLPWLKLGRLNKVGKKLCSSQRRSEHVRNDNGKAKLEKIEIFPECVGGIEE